MSSGADGGDVDRGGDDAAGQRGHDLLGGLDAGAVLRLGGRGAEVRRDDDVGVAVEQRVVGDRLGREDVERGAGDLAGVERVLERLVDEQLAAGAVDDPHAVLHLRERLGVEPAARLGRLGQVDGDEVGLARRRRRRSSACSTPSSRKRSADDERVEGQRRACRSPARAAATSWPMRPKPRMPSVFSYSSTPPNFERSHLPAVSAGVRLRDVAREREHQRHGVLGGGDDVRLRRVGDDDAALGRGLDVDVVDADAGAADDAEVVGAVDQVGGQLRRRADQDRRRSRRSAPRAPRRSSRPRRRPRSARAACPRRSRRSSP